MDDMPQNGFSQEQLVIYKLGQIESQLAALLVKLTDDNLQTQKDLTALEIRVTANEVKLEKFGTDRAKFLGGAAVITAVIAFGKDFFTQWLTSLLHH